MRQIELVQKLHRMSLTALARGFAARGLSLRRMAEELGLEYANLKKALRLRGYSHPAGMALVAAKIRAETQWELPAYVSQMITEGLSRNAIASELGVDNKTLQGFAEKHGLLFPVVRPVPRDFTAIIAAIRLRRPARKDLIWIEFDGRRQYLAQWAAELNIPRATLKKRLQLGWSIEQVLTTPLRSKGGLPRSGRTIPSPNHPWRLRSHQEAEDAAERKWSRAAAGRHDT